MTNSLGRELKTAREEHSLSRTYQSHVSRNKKFKRLVAVQRGLSKLRDRQRGDHKRRDEEEARESATQSLHYGRRGCQKAGRVQRPPDALRNSFPSAPLPSLPSRGRRSIKPDRENATNVHAATSSRFSGPPSLWFQSLFLSLPLFVLHSSCVAWATAVWWSSSCA